MKYNFDRPYEQRIARYKELSDKQVTRAEGKWVVITTRDGYDGDFRYGFESDRHYFTNKRGAGLRPALHRRSRSLRRGVPHARVHLRRFLPLVAQSCDLLLFSAHTAQFHAENQTNPHLLP